MCCKPSTVTGSPSSSPKAIEVALEDVPADNKDEVETRLLTELVEARLDNAWGVGGLVSVRVEAKSARERDAIVWVVVVEKEEGYVTVPKHHSPFGRVHISGSDQSEDSP